MSAFWHTHTHHQGIFHRQGVEDSRAAASCHGPISQRQLLQSLGIEARLQALLQKASPAEADMLQIGYMRLIGSGAPKTSPLASADGASGDAGVDSDAPEGMGLTYQAMAITSSDAPTPVAFEA